MGPTLEAQSQENATNRNLTRFYCIFGVAFVPIPSVCLFTIFHLSGSYIFFSLRYLGKCTKIFSTFNLECDLYVDFIGHIQLYMNI